MNKQDILKMLHSTRKIKGFCAKNMAEALNCKKKEYLQKESGIKEISTDEWLIIANQLNIPFELLFLNVPDSHREDYIIFMDGLKRLNQREMQALKTTLTVFLRVQSHCHIPIQEKHRPLKTKTHALLIKTQKTIN